MCLDVFIHRSETEGRKLCLLISALAPLPKRLRGLITLTAFLEALTSRKQELRRRRAMLPELKEGAAAVEASDWEVFEMCSSFCVFLDLSGVSCSFPSSKPPADRKRRFTEHVWLRCNCMTQRHGLLLF